MTSPFSPTRPRTGRVGRDLPAAIAVGVALVCLVVGALVVSKLFFVGVVVLAILLAVHELTTALAVNGTSLPLVPLYLGTVAIVVAAYFGGPAAMVLALAFTVIATMAWRLPGGADGYLRDVSAGALCAVYLPFMAGFAVLLLQPQDGAWRVVTFIVVVAASDTGGYAVGAALGRHPMAPQISPKKSWEGFGGSLVASVTAGVLLVVYALSGPWAAGVVLGAATAVTATTGDLLESLIKRDLGIKDMSSLLPGHGGLLDRLDSLVATVAVAWLVLDLLVPVSPAGL
jgi:phosphatidate cytidylyltransferase